ncbi:hypothetical protein A0H81_05638 [Grifola frondosa]|uniref:Uncharacterized protein n=1 Tax=Grifola frondosa TaxID=5627 RepID=A0A1C7ME56_GRIFR|nr:hypothetical protein A0H81_05638 [Grifola frondosa]
MPLWTKWSHDFAFPTNTVEMYKAPKHLYDPKNPTADPDEPVIDQFFWIEDAMDGLDDNDPMGQIFRAMTGLKYGKKRTLTTAISENSSRKCPAPFFADDDDFVPLPEASRNATSIVGHSMRGAVSGSERVGHTDRDLNTDPARNPLAESKLHGSSLAPDAADAADPVNAACSPFTQPVYKVKCALQAQKGVRR